MKLRIKRVDDFFFKYFNDNIKSENFIEKIKDEVYSDIAVKMLEYAMIGEIDYNKYTYLLYQKIKINNIFKDEQDRNNESDK